MPLVLLLVPLLFFGCLSAWFFQPNLGQTVGYYGRLNRAREIVRSVEGVQVLNEWVNYDVTLEEITFELLVDGQYTVKMYIPQTISLDNASHVILRRVDVAGTLKPLESPASGIQYAYEWNDVGLALSLGQAGELAARTPSRAADIEGLLTHLDEVLEYFRTTPLKTLDQRHRPAAAPAGAVWIEISDAP